MNESFRVFPETASRGASAVDSISLALLGITTVFSIGIMLAIMFFIAKYWHTRDVNRTSTASPLTHWLMESVWSLGPFVILMVMFTWGAVVYVREHQPPENALEINVVAKQWMWKVAHESGRREINSLHIPIGQPVRLTLISEDVIHSFFVPAFRTKQDVLPGRYTTLWFEPTRPGTYHLFCAEYCGTNHSKMIGEVVVQTPEEYAKWSADTDEGSLAQRGQRLFHSMKCVGCHEPIEGNQTGPSLAGLVGSNVPLEDGTTAVADAAYIRRSIVDPQAQRRVGFKALMPSYEDKIGPEQIMEIIAYLREAGGTTTVAEPVESSDREKSIVLTNSATKMKENKGDAP